MSKDVSIIIPVLNCEEFLDECFESIRNQNLELFLEERNQKKEEISLEVSVFDDGSTDKSLELIKRWARIFEGTQISLILSCNEGREPKGVGYARNIAVKQSTGEYLAFLDADDIMHPDRIREQYSAAKADPHKNSIIGSKYTRLPEGSTKLFTEWANSISQKELYTQIYLCFGPSLICPTWFMHRSVFERIPGGFDEGGRGVPEDLIFFYKHLHQNSGKLARIDKPLLIYRYHAQATTLSVSEGAIWDLRIKELEEYVLSNWKGFTIWNCGKLGRRFFRSLTTGNQDKVKAFGDVDERKLSKKHFCPHPLKIQIPIIHVTQIKPPLIICIKTEHALDYNGVFHGFLKELDLKEGVDFYYFN